MNYDESLSDGDEDEDPFQSNTTEDEVMSDPLFIYENNDRIDLTDWSEKWSSDLQPIREFPFSSAPKGVIKATITNGSTPRDVFDQLFTKDITEMLVNSMNEYGRELYGKPIPATKKGPTTRIVSTNRKVATTRKSRKVISMTNLIEN